MERSLSLAQYGIRAEICPSSLHDYHSAHMANDDLSLQISLTGRSTVFYYQTMDYGRRERMLFTTLVGSPNYPFLWYSSWGKCLSHEVFKELRVDSHRSIFTSVGVFPDLLRTLIRSSSRTVAFSCSAPAEPFHRLNQVSLFLSCLHSYGLTIRLFARPFLDGCTEFSFF